MCCLHSGRWVSARQHFPSPVILDALEKRPREGGVLPLHWHLLAPSWLPVDAGPWGRGSVGRESGVSSTGAEQSPPSGATVDGPPPPWPGEPGGQRGLG